MKIISRFTLAIASFAFFAACETEKEPSDTDAADSTSPELVADAVTDALPNDTDDPAIWIDPSNPENILILGNDKDSQGGLYAFDQDGKLIQGKFIAMERPNNVDVEYGIDIDGKMTDIAVVTERNRNVLRVISLPDFASIDGGGISVFDDSGQKAPMGISLYKRPADGTIYAIVSRKEGPSEGYLYQYRLYWDGSKVAGELVRTFGTFSGTKEIESIAVDDASGYVYYSDEGVGVRKYYADPDSSSNELAIIGSGDFKQDNEGISYSDDGASGGYLFVSDQQAGTFNVYARTDITHQHPLIGIIDVDAVESDGSETISTPVGTRWPNGLFIAMSDDKTFKLYDLKKFIDAMKKP